MQRLVVVNLESIEFRPNGSATGIVYWDTNGLQFPEAAWNDFVLTICNWWLEAALRLVRSETSVEQLRFMDGPFWVILRKCDSTMEVSFIDGGSGENVRGRFIFESHQVFAGLLDAMKRLANYCRSVNVSDEETSKLQGGVAHLEALLEEKM
jgi:SRSO17 transposase